MISEQSEQINRYMQRVWGAKETGVIYETFAADAVIHSPLGEAYGPAAMEGALMEWLRAFPDIKVTLLANVERGDKVVVQWRCMGTHGGTFMGVEPTNLTVFCDGCSIYRLHGGMVVEYWAYINLHHILEQMGVHETANMGSLFAVI